MRRTINTILFVSVFLAALTFSSCASKKSVPASKGTEIENTEKKHRNSELFDKVIANAVTNDALYSKIKFTVQSAEKSISVAGQIELKNDKYIRIRLTPMGIFEVAMIEFTSDYVLVLDRMHKEYIRADYSELPFLKANGIDFYALQSLFRNMIFVPGMKHVDAGAYKKFDFGTSGTESVLSLRKGSLSYNWLVNGTTGIINKTEFTYVDKNGISKLNCSYSDFEDVEGKNFPHRLSLSFSTSLAREMGTLTLLVSAKKFKAEQKGSGEITTIPRKYTEKDVREMLKQLLEIK